MEVCKIEECQDYVTPKSAKGMCPRHYKRTLRGASVYSRTDFDRRPAIIENGVAKIPLGTDAADGFALVDEEFAFVAEMKWHLTNKRQSYGRRYVSSSKNQNGRVVEVKLHQLVMGKAPKGKVIDHVSGNRLDNRMSNLRFTTRTQNARNHVKYRNNTSGYIGAYLHKPSGGWMSKIGHNGKLIHLGTFRTAEEAARTRDKAALDLHGEFAVLNFPT